MLETRDILETINMIDNENLDVRTITMGISLLDCIDDDIDKACDKVYDKICRSARDLVKTGEDIEKEYGIPIINKRISVTPIGMGGAPARGGRAVRLPFRSARRLRSWASILSAAIPRWYRRALPAETTR